MAFQGGDLLKLYIKVPSNQRSIEIEALSNDTIERIRFMIAAKGIAPKDQYALFHSAKELDQNKTLAHFKIKNKSILYTIVKPREELSIRVKMLNGETLRLKLHALYTIQDAKAMVESMVGYYLVDQTLFFERKQLESSKTLSYYDCIKEDSMLEMLHVSQLPIFIKSGYGNTRSITLCMGPHDLVEKVKFQILSKLKIPVEKQTLRFQGKSLEDNKTLDSYNIHRDSTLKLTVSSSMITETTSFFH